MTKFLEQYGLWILFTVVLAESSGVPVPGETTLIAAGVLSSNGTFSILSVILIAAIAAVIGDNVGYLVGRYFLRHLVEKISFFKRIGDKFLPPTERLFERHGGKAIFIARFLPIVRCTAAWMAGLSRMSWPKFFVWNAAGGVVWAITFGVMSYLGGVALAAAVAKFGMIGGGVIVVLAICVIGVIHMWNRRIIRAASAGDNTQ